MPRLLIALVLAASGLAQETADQPSFEQKVDRIFRGCARPGVPGTVVLVARGDEILLQKAYGLADLERNVPLSTDSVLDIGSTSKQFTAACLLLLQQDGKLKLSDPVRKHVDELPSCCDGITLRHLMLHISGIPDYIGILIGNGSNVEDRTTTDDALLALSKIDKLDFPFGNDWAYSNSNYLLMSVVVERVSGVSLADFAKERIFEPLGMKHTHVHRDCTSLVENRALSYSRGMRGGWRWNFSNWEQTGDGAVLTTVGDLLKWSRNFEHKKVGGDALAAAMGAPGKFDDGRQIDYGAGLIFEKIHERDVVSHGGAWAAYRAELMRVPGENLTIVCLCNRDDLNPSKRAKRILRLLLD